MDTRDVFDLGLIRALLTNASEPAGEPVTMQFDDIGFTVMARPHAGGASVSFQCYQQTSAGASGEPGDPRWYGGDAANGSEQAFNTEDSPPLAWDDARLKPYLAGDVKWDGCSNWGYYADKDGVMLHFCGRGAMNKVTVLLNRLYDVAKEMMGPDIVHDPEMFEGHGPKIAVTP